MDIKPTPAHILSEDELLGRTEVGYPQLFFVGPERIVGYASRKALAMLANGDLDCIVISKTHDADTVPVYTKD